MSGLEIATGTIAIIEVVCKTVQGIYELRVAYKEAQDVPEAFQDVLDRLPLVNQTLRRAIIQLQQQASVGLADDTYADVRRVTDGCKEKSDQLKELFVALAPVPERNLLKKMDLARKRYEKRGTIAGLAKSMMEHLGVLANYSMVESATRQAVNQAETELTEVLTSITKEDQANGTQRSGGGNAYHYGSGNQFSHQGTGTATFYGGTVYYGRDH